MAKISSQPIKIVKKYLKELKPYLKIEKAILFGSAAKNTMHQDSDLDFIIISPDFKNMDFTKRLIFLSKMRGEKFASQAMDILGYTNEEFEKLSKESVILKEAKQQGKIIK